MWTVVVPQLGPELADDWFLLLLGEALWPLRALCWESFARAKDVSALHSGILYAFRHGYMDTLERCFALPLVKDIDTPKACEENMTAACWSGDTSVPRWYAAQLGADRLDVLNIGPSLRLVMMLNHVETLEWFDANFHTHVRMYRLFVIEGFMLACAENNAAMAKHVASSYSITAHDLGKDGLERVLRYASDHGSPELAQWISSAFSLPAFELLQLEVGPEWLVGHVTRSFIEQAKT